MPDAEGGLIQHRRISVTISCEVSAVGPEGLLADILAEPLRQFLKAWTPAPATRLVQATEPCIDRVESVRIQ